MAETNPLKKLVGKIDPFVKARLSFVFWHLLIVEIILLPLSLNYYAINSKDLDTVLRREILRNQDAETILAQSKEETLQHDLNDLKSRNLFSLLILNLGVLLLSGIIMYIVSGRNLKPVVEALEREKDFVSNASHELRTPISSIKTVAEVALRDKNKNTESLTDALNLINDESMYSSKVVNELLEISRVESGNIKIDKSNFYLVKLVKDTITELQPLASKSDITITTEFPDQDIEVNNDRNKLKQIVTNILNNAVKYSVPGGKIEITVKALNKPEIIIKDYGIGIPDNEKQHIFEKFYRGSKARSFATGTGLGLPLAKYLAGLSGVSINIDSKPVEGTTAVIRF